MRATSRICTDFGTSRGSNLSENSMDRSPRTRTSLALLTRIETILNCRPLYPLTNDPDDLNILTSSFPCRACVNAYIRAEVDAHQASQTLSLATYMPNGAKFLDKMVKGISAKEYQRFHAMYNWNRPSLSISIGILALIINERYSLSKWPLGRIVQIHSGADNLVRVVSIKTGTSILQRPITKICPLPIDTPFEECSSPESTKAGIFKK